MTLHQPVLLHECIEGLAIKPDGIYVDGTYGRGGHSQAIVNQLGPKGRLIAIDKDPDAIAHANGRFIEESRFEIVHGSYADIDSIANDLSIAGKIDGILLDCGVSSPQLDESERGFSFMQDGPLDMRMNTGAAIDAKAWVNQTATEEMARVFKAYGEERFAKRIANAIEKERNNKPITTTLELAEIVKAAHPRWEKHKHPATRVFQAIRIEINNELEDLERFLERSIDVLTVGGRLVIISFHSLEDRIVKQCFKKLETGPVVPKEIPQLPQAFKPKFKRVNRKAIKAGELEMEQNYRARSAVLRIGEKLV